MNKLHGVKTGDIRVGDVVLNYGMRIRIDEIHEVEDPTTHGGRYWACYGTVLNVEDAVSIYDIPRYFMRNAARDNYGPDHPDAREDFWNVQGNDLATWTVERQ